MIISQVSYRTNGPLVLVRAHPPSITRFSLKLLYKLTLAGCHFGSVCKKVQVGKDQDMA